MAVGAGFGAGFGAGLAAFAAFGGLAGLGAGFGAGLGAGFAALAGFAGFGFAAFGFGAACFGLKAESGASRWCRTDASIASRARPGETGFSRKR